MSVREVERDRWFVEIGGGLVLEVMLVSGMAWGFWRWRGELIREIDVGEA